MNSKPKQSIQVLVRKLRLMADSGGMLTRDRIRVIIETADRLEELDERIAIISADLDTSLNDTMFP